MCFHLIQTCYYNVLTYTNSEIYHKNTFYMVIYLQSVSRFELSAI